MAFEVATYTDVTAEEAVDGVDGFNFRSSSPGLTGVDRQHIRESLLHRVVPSWSLGNDPLDHPPTCAFVVRDGRNYLSRGRSTGITNSGRPGNQVTQVIATSDPDDFVPYRPAQLYGACRWNLEKAAGPRTDPWVTPLEIRPEFEVEALQELVIGDEWARQALPYYLTMVEQAAGPEPAKAVLLHTDLDTVMRWIALGTLFVTAERARTLHFRALVEDPWRVDAALVGVSPEFGAGDLGSAHVLDLVNRTVPQIEPSEAARAQAALFAEHDAADALSAVETARRWETVLGAGPANDAARLVGVSAPGTGGQDAWHAAVSAIDRLAEAGWDEELALYGEELSEAVNTYGPTTAEEFALAGRAVRHAHERELDELACEVLVPVLEALAAVPEHTGAFARETAAAQAPIEWASEEERAAVGEFLGTVFVSAPEEALPDLFGAARVIAAPVPRGPLTAAVEKLSILWSADPELGRGRWRQWLAGTEVAEATSRRLTEALSSGENRAVSALQRGDWDLLAEEADEPELRGWVQAGQISRLPRAERRRRVATALSLPEGAWRMALEGVHVRQDPALWGAWVARHGCSGDLLEAIRAELDKAVRSSPGTEAGTVDWGPLLRSLVGAPDPVLARMADDYVLAEEALADACRAEEQTGSGAPAVPALARVHPSAPFLLPDIGRLLIRAGTPERRTQLITAVAPWGADAVRAHLVRLAERDHDPEAIGHALRLRSDPDRKVAAAAEAVLARITDTRPELVTSAKGRATMRGDLESYLRERSGGAGRSRGWSRPGGPFGWARGRGKDKGK